MDDASTPGTGGDFAGIGGCPVVGPGAGARRGPVGMPPREGAEASGERSPREGVDPEVLEFAQRLFQLARDGRTEELAAYVDAGVTPDLTNERGDGLLMLAAYNGHAETVAALLQRGASVERANDRGQTPLAGAVFKGYGEVVRLLFEAGADPQAGTPTAVETARMFEKDAFLELFGV